MSISRPRFIGPYGTGAEAHNAFNFQHEIKGFVSEVLNGIEDDERKVQLAAETERLHRLFDHSGDWYREMATRICPCLHLPLGISTGSDIIDKLRVTLSAYVLPYSASSSDSAYRQAYFYRTVSGSLRSLFVSTGKNSNLDDLKEHFIDQALFVFRDQSRVSIIVSDGPTDDAQDGLLDATCSLINNWDDGHDKVWSKDEKQDKEFQELQTVIKLLRKETPEASLRENRRRGDENEVRNRNQARINVALDHEERY